MKSYIQLSICLLWYLNLVSAVQNVCPRKLNSLSGDYNAKERFRKMKLHSKKVFTLTHTHKRENDGKEETYVYTIQFCGQPGEDAVIQKEKENEKYKSLGKFTNGTIVGGEDWLLILYEGGEQYGSHCHNSFRETWISIRCEDQGESPTMRLIEEARYKTSSSDTKRKCYYLFEYNHPDVCNHRAAAQKKLSGGAIFLIIAVSVFGAYLLFGFFYQRFVAKAKGFEQIPNFAFWRKVGNMSADGCDFVCRREERHNTYKGMADALNIESDEEERDDGLLPM